MTNRIQRPVKWLPVLMYHRVIDRVDPLDSYEMNISTGGFEAQMADLHSRGYQAIPLDQVPLAISERSPWTRPIAITFDDGYRDTYTHAYPILKKYGLVATIMLVSEFIGGRNTWDHGSAESVPLLSVDEIRQMEQNGMCFGAHTATHPSLPDISLDRVRGELADSKAKIEDLLGRTIGTLAYPYGRSTPDVTRVAEEVGYSAAFGCQPRHHTIFNFTRINASSCQGDTFLWRIRLSCAYQKLRQSRSLRMLNDFRKRALHESTSERDHLTATIS